MERVYIDGLGRVAPGRPVYYGLDKTKDFDDYRKKYLKAAKQADATQRLSDKGIAINIEGAGKYREEVIESMNHLEKLTDEYQSTIVSYSIGNTGNIRTEMGFAYMMNGKTSVTINPMAYKINKATDALKLGGKQPLGITYHEFAHTLSQSKEKIDKEFWKEIRKLKREYDSMKGDVNWLSVKISDYADKDIDEFLAEAFTQAKLSDNPSPYAIKVLDIVDKYFKKKELEFSGGSSKILLKDILIHKSVGAKSKNYDVMDLVTGELYHFAEGTRLQNVEVFAGKGTKKELGIAEKYAGKYGGKPEDWQHVKAIGYVDTPEGHMRVEVHWMQCEGIGRIDFFVKEWLE